MALTMRSESCESGLITWKFSDAVLKSVWKEVCPQCNQLRNVLIDFESSDHCRKICLNCLEFLYCNSFPNDNDDTFKQKKKTIKEQIKKLKEEKQKIKLEKMEWKKRTERALNHCCVAKKDDSLSEPTEVRWQNESNGKYFVMILSTCVQCLYPSTLYGAKPGICLNCMKELFVEMDDVYGSNYEKHVSYTKKQLEQKLNDLEKEKQTLLLELNNFNEQHK
jgi:hypothetical protein